MIAFFVILGIVVVLFILIYIKAQKDAERQYYERKREEERKNPANLSPYQKKIAEQRATKYTHELPIKGVDNELIMDHAAYNDEIKYSYDDIKSLYERGDKIYEYDIIEKNVSLADESAEKIEILIDDTKCGYLNQKDSEKYRELKDKHTISELRISGHAGRYMKIVRNDSYNPEYDDEYNKNWIEWEELSKPKVNLVVVYK